MRLGALCVFIILLCSGCVAIPVPLEDSVHEVYKGTILICDDYVNLVIEHYEGEEEINKLLVVQKHIQHMKELDKYVDGKGGRITWPWSGPKEDK